MVTELQKPDADPNTHIILSIGYSARMGGNMCMNTVYYTQNVENPTVLEQSIAKGGNSLGLNPSDGPAVSVLLLNYWQERSGDERILTVMKDALEGIRAQAVGKGKALDYVYLNYAASLQDPIGSYGAENKKSLQEVSKKYDPEGLFQKGVPGGFKLYKEI